MSEAPSLAGKYHHTKSEGFDDFLNANGVNWMIRKMAGASNPDLEVTQDGNSFRIKLSSMVSTRESAFTIGEDFEEKQHSGAVMKVTPKWEGSKLVLNYVPKEGEAKAQTHTRELDGNQLILTLQVGEVSAKRYFDRVPAS